MKRHNGFVAALAAAALVIFLLAAAAPLTEKAWAQKEEKPADLDQTPAGQPVKENLPNGGYKEVYKNGKGERIREDEFNGLGAKTKSKQIKSRWKNNQEAEVVITTYGTRFGVGGVVTNEEHIKYDKNGKEIEKIVYSDYDKNGKPQTRTVTDKDGTRTEKWNPKAGEGMWEPASFAPGTQVSLVPTIIGVVRSARSQPGEPATISLVTHPENYDNVPGIQVEKLQLSLPKEMASTGTLTGLVLDTGDGERRPADEPFTVQLPDGGAVSSVTIVLQKRDDPERREQLDLPMRWERRPAEVPSEAEFETPALYVDGAVQFMRGRFHGRAETTKIAVDGKTVKPLCESRHDIFYTLPPGTTAGPHEVQLQEETQRVTFVVYVLRLIMSADELELHKGQRTKWRATVSGPETLPDWAWEHAEVAPELASLGRIQQLAPGFRVPSKNEKGTILLRLENMSRDAITIGQEVVVLRLTQEEFRKGPYTYNGDILAKRDGRFRIDGLAAGFTGFQKLKVVQQGGNTKWGRMENFDSCPCEYEYTVATDQTRAMVQPNAAQLNACLANPPAVALPSRKCKDDCIHIRTHEWNGYVLYQNLWTDEFILNCESFAQYHCTKPTDPERNKPPQKTNPEPEKPKKPKVEP